MRTYTGSTNCDDRAKDGNNRGKIMVNLKENCRDPEEIARLNQQYIANGKPPKYDINKAHLNIYYETCKTTEEAFQYVFGDAMEDFNSRQKRNDRKTSVEKEIEKLSKGKVKQELIHCMVVQVGNHDSHPPVDECVEILQEYRERFVRQFPNMRIVSCSIHLDELGDGSPHLQIYFVPVKTRQQHEALGNSKKWSGMDVQPSLTGALEQMGYTNDATVTVQKKNENGEPILDENGEPVMKEVHDYKGGAMAQWQKDFNGLLDEICRSHDIEIDHYMRGKKVSHQDTRDYYAGKINQQVMQATRVRDKAEAESTQALFDAETAREEAEKLQKANDALKDKNDALLKKNEALERRAEAAEQRAEKAEKKADAAEQRATQAKQKAAQAEGRLAEAEEANKHLLAGIDRLVKSHDGLRRALNVAWHLPDDVKDKIEVKRDKTDAKLEKVLGASTESLADLLKAADTVERAERTYTELKSVAKGDVDLDDFER